MKLLFPDFASSAETFHAAEKYWQGLFDSYAKQLGASALWTPWHEPYPFEAVTDANQSVPVFSAVNASESRGLQIDYWLEETDHETIFAFTKTFGENTDNPIYLLHVTCLPTEKTIAAAEALLKIWLMPGAVLENLSVHIMPEHFRFKNKPG